MSDSFNRLPREIKLLIWELALPDDVPEVCILWPLVLRMENDVPTIPLLVDTAFPALMHVCREWRDFVLTSGLRLRQSTLAGCPVPFRAFRPELDTLYISSFNHRALCADIHDGLVDESILSEAENIALEVACAFEMDGMDNFVCGFATNVRTLSLVFSDAKNRLDVHDFFQAPARRCRLERFTPEYEARTIVMDICDDEITVDEVKARHRRQLCAAFPEHFDNSIEGRLLFGGDIGVAISGLTGDAAQIEETISSYTVTQHIMTFGEYRNGVWTRPCGVRELIHEDEPPYIPPSERPNPEEVRPNDLDGNDEGEGFL